MMKLGDFVFLKKGTSIKLFQIKKSKQVIIDRFKCNLESLIDQPYGFQFEISNNGTFQLKLNKTDSNPSSDRHIEIKDNRHLVDTSDNQKLSKDEIEDMKDGDINGDVRSIKYDSKARRTTSQFNLTKKEIIGKIIENSLSFDKKTEYSKEKYLKKKKNKYLAVYQIIKPSFRMMCEYYMQDMMKRKVLNLRIDILSQILTYANIAAYRNTLVIESCKGLIVAGIAERMGGFGKIINLSPNGAACSIKDTLNQMNFSDDIKNIIYDFPLEKIDKLDAYIDDMNSKLDSIKDEGYKEKVINKLNNAEMIKNMFLNRQIDCLVIVCRFRPLPILRILLNYMNTSRSFVVYCDTQEPIMECMKYLRDYRKAVNMEILDSWMREYQVIAERTHPHVMMDACSGYLLTGITVPSPNQA